MVGVAVFAAGHADGEDGAFVDDGFAVGGGDALAVVGVDGEGGDGDGIVFGGIGEDVFLSEDVEAFHAAAFADIELGGPVGVVGEFVFGEAEFGELGAVFFGDGGVGGEEVIEFEGVLAMGFPDLGAGGGVGFAPAVAGADEAHGELFADAVVGVEFFAREWVEVPEERGIFLLEEPAAGDFEAGGVVVVRGGEGEAVGGVVGEAEAEAVDHDVGVSGGVGSGVGGGDEGEWGAIGGEA